MFPTIYYKDFEFFLLLIHLPQHWKSKRRGIGSSVDEQSDLANSAGNIQLESISQNLQEQCDVGQLEEVAESVT